MRGYWLVTALVAGSALLSACGGGVADLGSTPGGTASGAATPAQRVYGELNALGPRARAAAEQGARKEGEVTVYTSMTSDVASAISQAFRQRFGIKVNLFRANSETVLQRALQEGQAARPGADIYETDFQEMDSLHSQHRLGEYQGAALDKVRPQARFGDWTADRLNIFLPAWNTNLVKPGEQPRTWEDLADPRYRGKLQIEVSDNDWYENLTRYWLTHGKTQQQVDRLWAGIVANAKTAKGHTTMMELLGAGQTAMDTMNYSYITDRAAAAGAPVSYRGPDGTTSVPAFPRPNGIGMEVAAPHPYAAWLFYDWLLSDGQQVLVNLHLTPVINVPGDTSLNGVTLTDFDVETLTRDAKTWQRRYDQLLRGVAGADTN